MFAAYLALALSAALQAPPAPASPPAKTTIVILEPKPPVESEEVKRLRAELPKARTAAALLNSNEIADAMDYPREAIAKNQQGRVRVWLLVGPDGRVQRCGINESSGSAALDGQTCDLFVVNAKFRPAKDKRGRAVAGLYQQDLVWVLEGSERVIEIRDVASRDTFIVGPEGTVRSCKSELLLPEGDWIEGSGEQCETLGAKAGLMLRMARQGSKLHDAEVVLEAAFWTTAGEALPAVANNPGDVLVYRRTATLNLGGDGKIISCTPGETFGPEAYPPDPCANPAKLVPPESFKPGTVPSQIRIRWAVYLKNEPNASLTPR